MIKNLILILPIAFLILLQDRVDAQSLNNQSIKSDSFDIVMNKLTSDTAITNYLYLYDYLDEKSLFVGYTDINGLNRHVFTNDIGAKIYVWPMDWIFFESIPFWLEIDYYSIENRKLTIKFHTVGIKFYRDKQFIKCIFVYEKSDDSNWIKKFEKIDTYIFYTGQ